MFKTQQEHPMWCDPDAKMYNGIELRYDSYNCKALSMTLRALLFNKEINNISGIDSFDYSHSSTRVTGDTFDEVFSRITSQIGWSISSMSNKLLFIEVNPVLTCDKNLFDWLSEEFCKTMNDVYETNYSEVTKIALFYKKTLSVRCFIDPEKMNSIVIYEKKGLDCTHYVQLGIPTYLPWFFCARDEDGNVLKHEDGTTKLNLSPIESDFLKTLRERESAPYMKMLGEIAELYKLDEVRLESMLGDFEKQWAQAQVDNVRSSIEDYNRRIRDYETEISNLITLKRDKSIQLTGIISKINETDCKTLDYFKSNKNLHVVRCESGKIRFDCTGYLECYDEDVAEEFVENKRSVIYSYSNYDSSDTYKLFKAVFVDKIVKLRSMAQYVLNINSNRVEGTQSANYTAGLTESYFPNSHIHRYACLGDYSRMMCEALENEDVVACLELCQMSTRSLNFSDTTVMEHFCDKITSWNKKVFELPDGKSATPREVIKYVSENEKKEEE